MIIDTAAIWYERSQCDAMVVVAMPGRVHSNWVRKEIPLDLPDRIPRLCYSWDSSKIGLKREQAKLEELLTFRGLAVLTVNGEAVIRVGFRTYLARFLKVRRALFVLDEFSLINATPGSQRTKTLKKMGKHPGVVGRRILDGTPFEDPLGVYSPMEFLDPAILGFTSFYPYKHRYAKWKIERNHARSRVTGKNEVYEALDKGENDDESPYINQDELRDKLARHSYRITRRELGCTAEKVYQQHPFQLTPVQRRVYDELAKSSQAEFEGGTLTAKHALTRIMRLQQCASNYWPPEKVGFVHELCAGNGCEGCDDLGVVVGKTALRVIDLECDARLEALREVLNLNLGTPLIIWARFDNDVDKALALARELGFNPARYDGKVSNEEKDEAEDGFQQGRYGSIVGKQQSGGRGLRLSRAKLIIYYSNQFSLLGRQQSEDRAEDLDKTEDTGVIDITAEDTVDDGLIVPALRSKKKVFDYLMGDKGGRFM